MGKCLIFHTVTAFIVIYISYPYSNNYDALNGYKR